MQVSMNVAVISTNNTMSLSDVYRQTNRVAYHSLSTVGNLAEMSNRLSNIGVIRSSLEEKRAVHEMQLELRKFEAELAQ